MVDSTLNLGLSDSRLDYENWYCDLWRTVVPTVSYSLQRFFRWLTKDGIKRTGVLGSGAHVPIGVVSESSGVT